MADALSCWATWNRGECRGWVQRVIADDEGLVSFLQPFMREAGAPSASARGPYTRKPDVGSLACTCANACSDSEKCPARYRAAPRLFHSAGSSGRFWSACW